MSNRRSGAWRRLCICEVVFTEAEIQSVFDHSGMGSVAYEGNLSLLPLRLHVDTPPKISLEAPDSGRESGMHFSLIFTADHDGLIHRLHIEGRGGMDSDDQKRSFFLSGLEIQSVDTRRRGEFVKPGFRRILDPMVDAYFLQHPAHVLPGTVEAGPIAGPRRLRSVHVASGRVVADLLPF